MTSSWRHAPRRCCRGRAEPAFSGRVRLARWRLGAGNHRDLDLQLLSAAAEYHAAQGRDVAEVAAPTEGDVFGLHQAAVGRVEIHPAEGWAKHRDPGVGRIGADQPWLAGRWLGQQVAADVTRRQTARAQAGEHQVGEVLAHATAALQHFHQRRGDLGGFSIEGELAENLLHQRL